MARAQQSLGSNLDVPDVGIEAEKPKMVRIQLEENESIPPGGQFIGVQGEGYILKPGVPTMVPLGVVEVLDNMVMSVPIQDEMQTVIGFRDRLRFPYRMLKPEGDARA